MIVLSWVLLAAAVGSLIYGLTREGLTFIYVSIAASVGAMLFLLGGILRKRPVQPATAGAPYGPPPGAAAARTAETTLTRPAPARRKAPTRPATKAPASAPSPATPTTRKPAAKKPASRKPATPKKTTAKKSAAAARSTSATVVALPERGTYHEASCRFVKGKRDTERLSMTTAKRRGYNACGVCKPGD
ncbi:MAG TPA: hypothetical protein VG602_04645 [Actinomycetota bacterium]|nr:hypothetical protein [Actinomycetota bacterium]